MIFLLNRNLIHIFSVITCHLFPDHLTRDCSMPKGVSIMQIPRLLDKFLSILELQFKHFFFSIIFSFFRFALCLCVDRSLFPLWHL